MYYIPFILIQPITCSKIFVMHKNAMYNISIVGGQSVESKETILSRNIVNRACIDL